MRSLTFRNKQSGPKRLGVIGHFGFGSEYHDGQTVKTKTLADTLESYYGKPVERVDTHDYKRHSTKLVFEVVKCLLSCDAVFVLLSRNGRRVLLPFLANASGLFKCSVHHCLIGGNLADEAENNDRLIKTLNKLEKNWVETRSMVDRLRREGVSNAEYLPNFKKLTPVDIASRQYSSNPPFKLCTFSRVMEEKGITDAICAVRKVNENNIDQLCTLDIFGPVEEGYKDEFRSLLNDCPAVRYCGAVDYSNTIQVLSEYDLLLFPTKWEGEGVPGTVIDAFAAGLPVIASRWRYYGELLEDNITGLSFEQGDVNSLASCISSLLNRPNDLKVFGENSRKRYEHYSAEGMIELICRALD